MKIVIGSDCHDNFENLDKVIQRANEESCERFLFAGDFVSPFGLKSFEKFNGKVEMVWGNNEGEKVGCMEIIHQMSNVTMHGDVYEGKIDGLKIFMNHFPWITEMAAKIGEFDLVIYGHTHEYQHAKKANMIYLNPGNIKGHREDAGFVIFDTLTKEGKRILLV